ncbi:hypothetical protein AIOL_002330 [Candidatus Rhodobacter oscarellae]|uniref:Uncharacterized protein n=1 Tax=Candidatus Rhodobacter oscarellae TaxID=1675527 RepID=A0A0J9E3S5_9RHOB|nr:hypothetical protein [Candidatus Rhodobacter lobularis]KMW57367.1 hypothetical protein AIOL_002330 [Candidatus Rhodobacter lobularis]
MINAIASPFAQPDTARISAAARREAADNDKPKPATGTPEGPAAAKEASEPNPYVKEASKTAEADNSIKAKIARAVAEGQAEAHAKRNEGFEKSDEARQDLLEQIGDSKTPKEIVVSAEMSARAAREAYGGSEVMRSVTDLQKPGDPAVLTQQDIARAREAAESFDAAKSIYDGAQAQTALELVR